MANRKATIQNSAGIHVRPSGVILSKTGDYKGTIRIQGNGSEIDLKGVIGLLSMGLSKGDNISITVSGPDEEKMCNTLVDLFEYNFDFPPKG